MYPIHENSRHYRELVEEPSCALLPATRLFSRLTRDRCTTRHKNENGNGRFARYTQVNKYTRERHTCVPRKGLVPREESIADTNGRSRMKSDAERGEEGHRERQPRPGIFIFLFLMLAQPAEQTCSGP